MPKVHSGHIVYYHTPSPYASLAGKYLCLTSANSVGMRRLFLGIMLKRREEVGRRTETATVQIHFPAGEEVWKRFGRCLEEVLKRFLQNAPIGQIKLIACRTFCRQHFASSTASCEQPLSHATSWLEVA